MNRASCIIHNDRWKSSVSIIVDEKCSGAVIKWGMRMGDVINGYAVDELPLEDQTNMFSLADVLYCLFAPLDSIIRPSVLSTPVVLFGHDPRALGCSNHCGMRVNYPREHWLIWYLARKHSRLGSCGQGGSI